MLSKEFTQLFLGIDFDINASKISCKIWGLYTGRYICVCKVSLIDHQHVI